MRLQKATRFALIAVLELAARPDRYLSVAEIAERHAISGNHLAKVLRDLGRAGIVESVRGVGGGYQFVANPRRLTLLDVIRVFEDVREPVEPKARSDEDTAVAVAIQDVLSEIDDLAEATLVSISLETMLKQVGRRSARAPAPLEA